MYMLIAIIILIMVLIGFIIYTVSQPVDKEFNKSLLAMGELIGTFDDFDKIEKIQSDKLDIIINLNKGPGKINVFGKNLDIQEEDYFEIREEDNIIFINSKKSASRQSSNWIRLEVSLPNLEDLEVDIKDFKGVLDINSDIKSLKINGLRGLFTIDTKNSFDIEIDNFQGIGDFDFGDLNASLKFDRLIGSFDLFDNQIIDESLEGLSYNESHGQGRDSIYIKNIEGAIEID